MLPTGFSLKDLLTSRKLWAVLMMLAIVIISAFTPSFNLDGEAAAGFAVIIVAYIVGVAIDPGPNAGTWRGVLQSRKFWAAVVGLIVLFLNGFQVARPFGLSPEQLIAFAVVIGTYISGVGIEGLLKKLPSGVG